MNDERVCARGAGFGNTVTAWRNCGCECLPAKYNHFAVLALTPQILQLADVAMHGTGTAAVTASLVERPAAERRLSLNRVCASSLRQPEHGRERQPMLPANVNAELQFLSNLQAAIGAKRRRKRLIGISNGQQASV